MSAPWLTDVRTEVGEPTALYRLFDAGERLLYVGISSDPKQRWRTHAIEQKWWPEVAAKQVVWFGGRLDAAKAEAAIIRNERPRENLALPDEDGLGGWHLLVPRTKRPKPASGIRAFAVPGPAWERFGDAVERGPDPEADMSKVLRAFVRWYVGEPGAKLPERPDPPEES